MSNEISIGFTGDLSFSGYFSDSHNNSNLLDDRIKDVFASNSANVINYESPITLCRSTKKRRLAHRSDPQVLDYLKEQIPNPVLSFANNHMMDFRSIGVIDTVENTEIAEIPFIGLGRSLEEATKYVIIENNGIRVGLLSIQYKPYKVSSASHYAGPFSEKYDHLLKVKVEELKSKVDWIILVYHGGDEFLHAPMPYIRKLLKKYLSWGCDIVVGHHPHVVQGYEFFGKKAIFYSLGNFVFDTDYQRTQADTDRGIVLTLNLTKKDFTFSALPILIDRDSKSIQVADSDSHFYQITSSNYRRLWTTEASRKKVIKASAKELKHKEISERKDTSVNNYLHILQLRKAFELQRAKMEMEDDDTYLNDNDATDDEDYEINGLEDVNTERLLDDTGTEEQNQDVNITEDFWQELRALTDKRNLNHAYELDALLKKSAELQVTVSVANPVPEKAAPFRSIYKRIRLFSKSAYKKLIVNRKSNIKQMIVIVGATWANVFYKENH